jgi:AGZA family xanthine/uracil permease-like MFS transporter
VPAALTILLMPLTFSISEGLSLGYLAWAVLAIATGRWRRLSVTAWVLSRCSFCTS